jgi:predicted nucleic acid-binding protein
MKKILVDSGPLIALFDGKDKYHEASVAFVKANQFELVTTLASITETHYMLDFSAKAQFDFLGWVSAGAVRLEPIAANDLQTIRERIKKYSDLPMDFADACLVFLAEKLNINSIATIDNDFEIYKFKGKKSFTTLVIE